ncbi:MAG: FAD-dependent oxidoreductase, partial [Candidatus Limnocylindrales bacterium]
NFRNASREAVVACDSGGVAFTERSDSPALLRNERASLSAASISPRGPSPVSRNDASSVPESARRLGKDERVAVTLVDRRNFHLFTPLLYQVATGAVSPGDIAQPLRSILRRQKNTTVLLGEAVGVDVEKREVRLADGGPIAYDSLVIASGRASPTSATRAGPRTRPA